MRQNTIKNIIAISGIGLHSGKKVSIKMLPAGEDTGIVFKRVDIKNNSINLVPARFDLVKDTKLSTVLINDFGVRVSTIEHLMSALASLEIHNLMIEIDSFEVPILDGSSILFVEAIEKAGVKALSKPRKILKIVKPINLKTNNWEVAIIPDDSFILNVTIDFPNKIIGKQTCEFNYTKDDYKSEISKARTFCLEKEVTYLQSIGLAVGGSLDNAIVVGENSVLNSGKLRYSNEFARHKLLDALGDLFLAGYDIQGRFFGYKSGHESNNLLLRAIFADSSSYIIEEGYEQYNIPVLISKNGIVAKI